MFNKKISVGITVSLMAVTAAITFVITNNYSLSLFNSKVQSVTEREEIYTKLSELDSFARTKFYKEIDEDYLMECIAKGYIFGLQDNLVCIDDSRQETEMLYTINLFLIAGINFFQYKVRDIYQFFCIFL